MHGRTRASRAEFLRDSEDRMRSIILASALAVGLTAPAQADNTNATPTREQVQTSLSNTFHVWAMHECLPAIARHEGGPDLMVDPPNWTPEGLAWLRARPAQVRSFARHTAAAQMVFSIEFIEVYDAAAQLQPGQLTKTFTDARDHLDWKLKDCQSHSMEQVLGRYLLFNRLLD